MNNELYTKSRAQLRLLAAELKAARESLGLTVSELSALTNVSTASISNMETNSYFPTLWGFIKLATALDMAPKLIIQHFTLPNMEEITNETEL
jgi:transcriptional regulator with XRE-family HTH domain